MNESLYDLAVFCDPLTYTNDGEQMVGAIVRDRTSQEIMSWKIGSLSSLPVPSGVVRGLKNDNSPLNNDGFLWKNDDLLLKNVDFIIQIFNRCTISGRNACAPTWQTMATGCGAPSA